MNIFFFFLSIFIFEIETKKLITTHVIFRHGDRAPNDFYPTSSTDPMIWPNGLGQLTMRGRWQQVRLGRYLRQRYAHFLNTTYESSEIYIRSTDYDRTLMSAYANLLGLYPTSIDRLDSILSNFNNRQDQWPDNLPWQPIPVHTIPVADDYLLSNGDCPRFFQYLDKIQQSETIRHLNEHNRFFFGQLELWSGLKVNDIFDAWYIADTVLIEHSYGVAPNWANHSVLAQLENLTDLAFGQLFSLFEVNRLLGGPFLRQLMENVEHATKNQSEIYKHDITIGAVLAFFGLSNVRQPALASALIFDLFQLQDQSYAIQLDYLKSADENSIEIIPMGNCFRSPCPVDRWLNWLKDKVPNDEMKIECQAEENDRRPKSLIDDLI